MPEHRILILDDERDIGEYIVAVARLNSFAGEYFADPEAFLAAAEAAPVAVAIDLQMPALDGVEVLRRLAAIRFRYPIIIMSGMDKKVLESARHFAKANDLAVSEIVSKPVRVEELSGVFERLKRHARLPPSRSEFVRALERKEFSLRLQPKVALTANGIGPGYLPVGFEGLARWNSPTKGLVMPNAFIPQIMESGLGRQFSDHIFDLALATLGRWRNQGISATISINMSAVDVEDPTLADRLWDRCAGTGIDHQRIIIEVTESDAMRHPQAALDVLTRLRLKGFLLSLDDFGTGYSSLVHLNRLPFAELKIDRSLIADCGDSEQSRIIVRTIVGLGHSLGLSVVAEGVEDEETMALLRGWNCNLVQGYLVSRPMAPEAADAWWMSHRGTAH